jgi:hypothetical protein
MRGSFLRCKDIFDTTKFYTFRGILPTKMLFFLDLLGCSEEKAYLCCAKQENHTK